MPKDCAHDMSYIIAMNYIHDAVCVSKTHWQLSEGMTERLRPRWRDQLKECFLSFRRHKNHLESLIETTFLSGTPGSGGLREGPENVLFYSSPMLVILLVAESHFTGQGLLPGGLERVGWIF